MMKHKEYNSLDLFKFVFAIVVVSIHTQPFLDIKERFNWYYIHTFGNLAVPFFFMTSGFLLFKNINGLETTEQKKKVKKYILHLLKIYIVWCIIWLPWKMLNFFNSGHFTAKDILLYFRDVMFVEAGDALWYLPALAVAVALVYFLLKKINIEMIIVIALLFYVMGYAISSWYGLFESNTIVQMYYFVFSTTYNGVMIGFLFVTLGIYAGKCKGGYTPLCNRFCCIIYRNVIRSENYRGSRYKLQWKYRVINSCDSNVLYV